MKTLRFLLAVLASFITLSSSHANEGMWGSLNWSSADGGVNSSPISGFSSARGYGLGIKIGKNWSENQNISFWGGLESGSRKLHLTGRNLGGVDSMTFSGGGQLTFGDSDWAKPFIRGGIHYTTFEGSGLANNTMKVDSTGNFGLTAGIGMNFNLDKTSLKNDVINSAGIGVSKNWNSSVELRTNAGALMSNLKFNETNFGIWVGKSW